MMSPSDLLTTQVLTILSSLRHTKLLFAQPHQSLSEQHSSTIAIEEPEATPAATRTFVQMEHRLPWEQKYGANCKGLALFSLCACKAVEDSGKVGKLTL